MNAPARFRQSDITRAMKGAMAAGARNIKVIIDPQGNIEITVASDAPAKGDSMARLLARG